MSRTFTRVGKTPGIFKRGNTFYAGYRVAGRWTMKSLVAENVTEAKKERGITSQASSARTTLARTLPAARRLPGTRATGFWRRTCRL